MNLTWKAMINTNFNIISYHFKPFYHFIYFKLINFPVFNVADCYVTVSVVLLIILILFVYKEDDFNFLKISKKGDNNE